MESDKFVKRVIAGSMIITLLVLSFLVLKAVMISITIGLLFAYIFHPLFKKLNKRIKNKNISAFLLIIVLLGLIIVPIILITPPLVRQTFDTYVYFKQINIADIVDLVVPEFIDRDLKISLTANLNSIISKTFSSLLNQFTDFITTLPRLALQFVVFGFTFFFAIRDAEKLKNYMSELSPFSNPTEKKFLTDFRKITNALVYGQIFIGIFQGITLGIALFALGIPKALILTFVTMFVSLIPVLGSWLVWLPTGLILIATGNTLQGIIILLYGGLFVSTIDNILRPLFLSKHSQLPVIVGVVGIIGGIYYFGLVGIILGPLILAYLLILIDFYKQGKLDELFKK